MSRHDDLDPPPTLDELRREDAQPPDPPLIRDGRRAVQLSLAYEPIVHLAFDSVTTLCGQPWALTIVRSNHPTCGACLEAVDRV